MNKLAEKLSVVQAIAPQDIGTADVTGSYISMAGCNRVLAVLTTASLTAGKIAGIELLQATSAAGANAKALKVAVTGTAPVGNGVVTVQVEVLADEFDTNNGFASCRVCIVLVIGATANRIVFFCLVLALLVWIDFFNLPLFTGTNLFASSRTVFAPARIAPTITFVATLVDNFFNALINSSAPVILKLPDFTLV